MEFKILANEDTFQQVQVMAQWCYDVPGDDATVALGYNNFLYKDYKHNGKRLIVYQLEQLCDYGSLWFNPRSTQRLVRQRTANIRQWLTHADEIWDYDLDNIAFLQQLGYKNLRFMPMQYCPQLKFTQPAQPLRYDLLFFGTLNKRRASILAQLGTLLPQLRMKIIGTMPPEEARHYNFTISPPVHGAALEREILSTKAVLNLHYYETRLQEQVRMFPLIINDVPVVSERSRRNYFGGLITEFDGDLKQKVQAVLSAGKRSTGEKFRQCLRKNYKVGAAYNTFYGLEQIEQSIESIRAVADEIVIVHQSVSFSGEKQSRETENIINKLKTKYNVITYHGLGSDRNRVLLKRNAGLQHLKNKGCDFIMPLDTDERYDAQLLRREIDMMWRQRIDTLYCPIRTFTLMSGITLMTLIMCLQCIVLTGAGLCAATQRCFAIRCAKWRSSNTSFRKCRCCITAT